ncbi:CheR family methyltransferase [Rhodovulum sp. DZ06]|uniref:CheR family methyltransferase n=1 Tax=Rhodovulum sp. DZ06 TaxID=3425126 RepID=UPI003D34EA43
MLHDDRLSPEDFARVSALAQQETGIQLPPSKRVMLEGRLRRCARDAGATSLSSWCAGVLSSGRGGSEWRRLIDAVTTNKTDFMREPAHFELLRTRIVPELLRGRARRLKVWSAACSTGAEPWSIAMTLGDLKQDGAQEFDFAILGTDISEQALRRAAQGIYPSQETAPVAPLTANRWLRRGRSGDMAGQVRIAAELRRRVSFARINLMDDRYPVDDDVDVIFLRNVLIYFDRETQGRVIGRLLRHLRPGGCLLLGHAEPYVGP